MQCAKVSICLLICFFLASKTWAHIDNPNDPYWKMREQKAHVVADRSYNPEPGTVLNHINQKVHKGGNNRNGGNRRGLLSMHKYTGPCEATNPIDQCWRCDPNWAKNRQKLADCALGFGSKAAGGKGGKIYTVTDPSDNDVVEPKNGTLRHAVIQDEPLWIVFKGDMVIKLSQELIMASDKTIDGRGAQVHIAGGCGIMIQFIQNVIIHNIKIHDIVEGSGGKIRDSTKHFGLRTKSDGDGISIFGSSNIWIDHVSMSNCKDGIIDAVQGSTAITISNGHYTNQDHVMLFGASDTYSQDAKMQVTVAFNHYGQGCVQRMPRIRWGFAHVINNDYTQWKMYAIGGGQKCSILSQGNRFIASDNSAAKEVTKREVSESEFKNWNWKSENDLLLNGATFVESGDPNHKFATSSSAISPKPGSAVAELTRHSGVLDCVEGKEC